MREHRTRIRVSGNQDVHLVLPSDFPPGDAEVIVRPVDPSERTRQRKLTVDEFLSRKLMRPPGVGTVTLTDMDRAIADGANDRDGTHR